MKLILAALSLATAFLLPVLLVLIFGITDDVSIILIGLVSGGLFGNVAGFFAVSWWCDR